MEEDSEEFDRLFREASQVSKLVRADLHTLELQVLAYYMDLGMIPQKEPLTEEDKQSFQKFMQKALPQ